MEPELAALAFRRRMVSSGYLALAMPLYRSPWHQMLSAAPLSAPPGSVLGGVQAEMLFDAIEPGGVVINGKSQLMNMDADIFKFVANASQFCSHAVEPLSQNADLSLCFLVSRCDFGAHLLKLVQDEVFRRFDHAGEIRGIR